MTEFILVKWVDEQCWDVVPIGHAGLNEEDVQESIGQERLVKYNDGEYPANILEVGK